jgi:hypothetical protein
MGKVGGKSHGLFATDKGIPLGAVSGKCWSVADMFRSMTVAMEDLQLATERLTTGCCGGASICIEALQICSQGSRTRLLRDQGRPLRAQMNGAKAPRASLNCRF